MRPRVLLVDDQEDFRTLARELLEHAGCEVVGEAASAHDALRAARELRPDLVVLDVRLPDGSGLDVARSMTADNRPTTVVLVSTADYDHAVERCGAAGFILKQDLTTDALRVFVDGAA